MRVAVALSLCATACTAPSASSDRSISRVARDPPPLVIVRKNAAGAVIKPFRPPRDAKRCVVTLVYARDGSLAAQPTIAEGTGDGAIDERCVNRALTAGPAQAAVPDEYPVPLTLKRVLWIRPVDDAPVPIGDKRVSEVYEGGLSREEIQRVFDPWMERFRRCYAAALDRRPTLHGTVVAHFIIDGTGAVATIGSSNEMSKDPGVADCVTELIRAMQFPEPRGGGLVFVTYPFVFSHD